MALSLVIITAMMLVLILWNKMRPTQPLPISCKKVDSLPTTGEFVSEPSWQSRRLVFADLDRDGLRDKVVVDEKYLSPFAAKALLRVYWGNGRGRETLSTNLRQEPIVLLADLDGDGQKEVTSFVDTPKHNLELVAWKFDRQRKGMVQVSKIVANAPFSVDQTIVVDLGRDGREEIVTLDGGVRQTLKGFLVREVAMAWVFGWDEQKNWWRKEAYFQSKGQIIAPIPTSPVARMATNLVMMHLRTPHTDFFAIPVEVEKPRWLWEHSDFYLDWQYFTLLLQADSPDPNSWRLIAEVEGKPMKVADLDGDNIAELIAFDDGSFSIVRVSRGKVEVATLRGEGTPEVLIPNQPNGQLFVKWERSQWQQVSLVGK